VSCELASKGEAWFSGVSLTVVAAGGNPLSSARPSLSAAAASTLAEADASKSTAGGSPRPQTAETRRDAGDSEILVAFSTNRGHFWSNTGNVQLYGPYVIDPLREKYGDRIVFLTKEATPENIRRLVAGGHVKLFVWIGGGLGDRIECNDTEDLDCPGWRPGFEPGAPELKNKIAFINAEFSPEYLRKLPTKAGFGYWTEMSTSLHTEKYDCGYFADAPQPIDWYGPYFILMRKAIGWMAEGHSVKETAEKADQFWAGFLKWVEERRSAVPAAADYLETGKQMFGRLAKDITGDPDARLTGKAPP